MDITRHEGTLDPYSTRHEGELITQQEGLTNALTHALIYFEENPGEFHLSVAHNNKAVLFIEYHDRPRYIPSEHTRQSDPDIDETLQTHIEEAQQRCEQYMSYKRLGLGSPQHLKSLITDRPCMA